MSNQIVQSAKTIQKDLMSEGALNIFADNLPGATGKHAKEVARRFAKMVYTAVCQSDNLMKCTPKSIIKAASISASLDLDIDPRGLAYLVPYKNEAQFQIGYMGLIELAYRSGKVKAISAHCVYESEKGKVKISRVNGQYKIEHPFSYEKPSGSMVATYACAEVEGLGAQVLVLRADEIEKLRQCSKCPNSPAWANHPEAMQKKTVIRQLAKFLPKSILDDFSKGAAYDEREDFVEAQATAQNTIEAQSGSEIVEVTFEEPEQVQEPAEENDNSWMNED